MLPTIIRKLALPDVLELIEKARNAELCRDTESLQIILQTVWHIEDTPNFDDYDDAIKGELLRLSGVFLSCYGKYTVNRKNYQIRGKDILTNSIEIFETIRISEKAAEAKINLAFCYWNLGEVNECEAILNVVEEEFGKDLLHPVYLQICINRLLIYFWNQDLDRALKSIEEIETPMELCTDVRLQAMFHNQAGIFYRASEKYDKAVFHLKEAIRFAKKADNNLFAAINLNNLAYLYKEIDDFEKAFDCISKSIDKIRSVGHQGFLPHALDTQALIYLDWDKAEKALETINQSIDHFRQGEDYRGLTDALWTKVRCLMRLERSEDAFLTFAELEEVATKRIGEDAARKFAKKLSEEVYSLKHLPLTDEVTAFKKARVSAALIRANGVIGKATKILRLKNHQALSEILNKQFPDLLGELGYKRRAKRSTGGPEQAPSEIVDKNSVGALQERAISRLILANKNLAFDFKVPSESFETFYFDERSMKSFGIESEAIVVVIPTEFKAGIFVLISGEDGFSIGKTQFDEWAGIYVISDERGNMMPLNKDKLIGKPVGFSLVSEADNKFIRFSRLENP